MLCYKGCSECTGCGACSEPKVAFNCDWCGDEIYLGDDYYDIAGDKVCEDCLNNEVKHTAEID